MNTKKALSFLEAKYKIEAYCAYQERCEKEVVVRLNKWDVYGEQADVIIADLILNNFLNEERFAEAFVSGKIRIKKWGKIKIKQHLKQKQISNYSMTKALNSVDDELYLLNLNQLIEKKKKDLKISHSISWENRAKIQRFLQSKGYENDLIFEALKVEG
jgi:regulatory protein